MDRNHPTPKGRSPIRLLTIAYALTVAVLAWLGWNSYDSYRVGRLAAEQDSRIAELRGRMLHLDEVLTMSARMAAATGEPEWEERYRTFEPQLDAAIREAKLLAPRSDSSGAAAQTDAANIKLVAMENRAFDWVRQGCTDEAQEILLSDEYDKQRALYEQSINRFVAARQTGLRVTEVRAVIIHLNEVLMMSARMAAATGDPAWETRYRTFEPQLDAAIQEALAIEEKYDQNGTSHAAQIDAANAALVEMEKRAFDLVRAGRSEEARALLAGNGFEEHQELYAKGMDHLERDLAKTNIAILRSEGNRAGLRITAILLAIAMTVGAWLVVLRLLRKAQKRLTAANADLIAKGVELIKLNAGLDQRVEDQTRELREAKDYTDNIIGSMIDMLVVVAPDGRIVTVNEATCSSLGYAQEELIGQPASLLFPEEEEDTFQLSLSQEGLPGKRKVLRGLVRQGSISNIEKSLLPKSGEKIPVVMSSSAMRDNEGKIRGIVCVARDITERKRAENELRKLSVAVEQSPAIVIITDTSGTIEYVNPRFTEVTGYTKEEAIGQNPRMLKSGKWPRKAYEGLWNTVLSGKTWRGEFENKKKNGDIYWEAASISPVRNARGVITHFLAVKEDVTNRKYAQEELHQAKEAADAANKAKSEFLANMSHEIRTPMTAILGFTDILLDPSTNVTECVNAAHTIRRNGEALLDIINDILDISKIEAGKLTVECIESPVLPNLADVEALMRVRADAKGLAFAIEFVGPVPETIRTDSTRLRQILINLIGNAIKFTQTGGVRVVVRLVRDEGAQPYMQFDVIDSGIGLTEVQTQRIFEPFTQADSSTTRDFGGTGLGLTISRQLANLLGGDITASSRLGEGSLFRATVATGPLDGVKILDNPMETAGARVETRSDHRPCDARLDCRILVAEDGPDNQVFICHILRKAGADVTLVENGKLALDEALAARDQGTQFDVILMDMQMPVMDGYQATSLLRRKGYTGTIIALTAHAMQSHRQKCINAGCDEYASKPINRKKLISLIQEHTAATSSIASAR